MGKADEIREYMAARVAGHNARVAQSTVSEALEVMEDLLAELRKLEGDSATNLTMDRVGKTLVEFVALAELVGEAARSLPAKAPAADEEKAA